MLRLFPLAAALALLASPADAQEYGRAPARIGAGIDAVVIPLDQGSVDPGLGLGPRARIALPLNRDLSASAGLGLHANLLGSARLSLTPQVSMIVTIQQTERSTRYLIGGLGGYLPFSEGGAGATVHAGIGTAIPLSETSLYLELNPSIVIGASATSILVPVRAGVIF